jgi:hypothetical protein
MQAWWGTGSLTRAQGWCVLCLPTELALSSNPFRRRSDVATRCSVTSTLLSGRPSSSAVDG